MASVVVDVSQQRSDSSLGSKSTSRRGQLIEDNWSCEKTRDGVLVKCNHFSIRGYVAEVRKMDPILCDPFSPYLSHELPHMAAVPKFRWWQCKSCASEAGSSKWTDEEVREPVDEADADMPSTKQKLEVDVPKERNIIEAGTHTDCDDNMNDTPSSTVCADLKGKGKVCVEDERIPPTGVCRSESHQMSHTTDTIEIEPSREQLNHEKGNLINEKASEKAHNGGEVTKGIMKTQVAGIVDGPSGGGKARAVSLPDLNEFDVEPSDDNENEPLVTRNRSLIEDDDDYLGAERRKTPKVRLLSELLGLKDTQNDAKLKKKHPCFSTSHAPSAFFNSSGSDSPGLSSMDENAKRKRTVLHGDDSSSVEIKGSNNGTKKLRSPQISENDGSTDIISEALTKKRNRSTLEKNPMFEKRSKKIKFDHGVLPSVSRHKTMSKSNQEKGKPFHADIPMKNYSSAQVDDRNLLLNKGKGKAIQSGKEQTSPPLCKNHLFKDGTTKKDKETEHNGCERILNDKRQDRFLTTGSDHMSADPGKDGIHPRSSLVDSTLLNGSVTKHSEKRNTRVANLTLNLPTALYFMGNQYDACKEGSSCLKSNSKNRLGIREIRERGSMVHHTLKQVSNSLTNRKEATNEMRRRIQDIDINCLPIDDKVPEQSSEDDNQDIPMDIVELMARNQYERNLVDPKDNGHSAIVTSTSNCGKIIRSNGSNGSVNGDNMSNLGQPCLLSLQNPVTTNSRDNMVNGFEDISSSRLNLMNPFSDLNQNHVGMSLSSSQGHEHVSALSIFDSTPNNWNRHLNTQRYLPSNFFPPTESYNIYRASSPRPNIDARVLPSIMPLGISNPKMISQRSNSVNNGRLHHQAPSILNSSNTSLGKPNLNYSNAYNNRPIGSSSSGVGVRPYSKKRGEDYPPMTMESVDLYSNDTISAMHLLSLMQNRANIQPAVTMSHDQQYIRHHEKGLVKVSPPTSRQPLLMNNNIKSSMQESCSHPRYPALPLGRNFASPFSNDGGYGRNAGFVNPIPLTSGGQRNTQNSHLIISQSGDIGKEKGITRISSPLQGYRDSSNLVFGVAAKRDEKAVKRITNKVLCVVNRNPSELNDLREMSKYTIGPADLRPKGPSRSKGDGRKLTNEPMSIIPLGKDGDHHKKT